MQRNKYLDDLNIQINKYGTNFMPDTDERNEIWRKQKKEYGFDSRECWNLDQTFIEWLYSHLMMYLEDATGVIDLNYHKFEFDGKTYTQKEAIEFILERLRNSLIDIYDDKNEAYLGVYDAVRMWAEIFRTCWW